MMLRPFISLAIIGAVFLAGGLFFFTARNEFSQKTTSAPSKAASTPSPLVTEPTFSLPPEEDIYFGQGYNGQYPLLKKTSFLFIFIRTIRRLSMKAAWVYRRF